MQAMFKKHTTTSFFGAQHDKSMQYKQYRCDKKHVLWMKSFYYRHTIYVNVNMDDSSTRYANKYNSEKNHFS